MHFKSLLFIVFFVLILGSFINVHSSNKFIYHQNIYKIENNNIQKILTLKDLKSKHIKIESNKKTFAIHINKSLYITKTKNTEFKEVDKNIIAIDKYQDEIYALGKDFNLYKINDNDLSLEFVRKFESKLHFYGTYPDMYFYDDIIYLFLSGNMTDDIYKWHLTKDGGKTWNDYTFNKGECKKEKISEIAVSNNNPLVMYVLLEYACDNSLDEKRSIYKTISGGNEWVKLVKFDEYIYQINISPKDDNVLYIGTKNDIYKAKVRDYKLLWFYFTSSIKDLEKVYNLTYLNHFVVKNESQLIILDSASKVIILNIKDNTSSTIYNNAQNIQYFVFKNFKNNELFAYWTSTERKESSKSDQPKTKQTDQSTVSCYELGVRYGRCSALSFKGLPCNPKDDIIIPNRCRGKSSTKKGIKAGKRQVD